jgi:hypothetical protein
VYQPVSESVTSSEKQVGEDLERALEQPTRAEPLRFVEATTRRLVDVLSLIADPTTLP